MFWVSNATLTSFSQVVWIWKKRHICDTVTDALKVQLMCGKVTSYLDFDWVLFVFFYFVSQFSCSFTLVLSPHPAKITASIWLKQLITVGNYSLVHLKCRCFFLVVPSQIQCVVNVCFQGFSEILFMPLCCIIFSYGK